VLGLVVCQLCAAASAVSRSAPVYALTDVAGSYNSVLFSTVTTNKYLAVLATSDFAHGLTEDIARWEEWNFNDSPSLLHRDWGTLVHLTNNDCLRAYGKPAAASGWGSVVAITSASYNGSTVLATWQHNPGFRITTNRGNGWMCGKLLGEACAFPRSLHTYPADWTIPDVHPRVFDADGAWTGFDDEGLDAQILYCNARWYGEACQVKVGTTILAVVIACNVIKLMCIMCVVFSIGFTPVATLGDAIEFFLECPDDTTNGHGARDMSDYEQPPGTRGVNGRAKSFRLRKRRWGVAVGGGRWFAGLGLCDYIKRSCSRRRLS